VPLCFKSVHRDRLDTFVQNQANEISLNILSTISYSEAIAITFPISSSMRRHLLS
jgi:hypothetical protein